MNSNFENEINWKHILSAIVFFYMYMFSKRSMIKLYAHARVCVYILDGQVQGWRILFLFFFDVYMKRIW